MKIAVVTDSGSGFTKQEAEAKGIYFLPLQIVDEEATYLDGVDIGVEEIFSLMKEGKMMKTSLPPLGYVEDLFHTLKKEGYEHIICVSLTSGLSSTMQSIRLAAGEADMPISCVEIYTTCFIQRYITESAKRLVDDGMALEDILARLQESIDHSNTLIIPDDLDHLKRGGRLTPLAAALGGMLKIKPILKLNASSEGKIDTCAKVRTMAKAMQTAVDTFKEAESINEEYILVIMHTDAPQSNVDLLKETYFDAFPQCETYLGIIGPVISVHTGIGCLGIQYIKKV